jgi:hypothetical protein
MGLNRRRNLSSAFFILLILLILFFLWSAPSLDGPAIPYDQDHINQEGEISCQECHDFLELIKENSQHPPKTECLECHTKTAPPAKPVRPL